MSVMPSDPMPIEPIQLLRILRMVLESSRVLIANRVDSFVLFFLNGGFDLKR